MLLSKQIMAILLMVISASLVFAKPTVDHCATCQSISEFVQDMEQNQTESIMKTNFYKMCLKENQGSNSRVCVFLSSTMQNTLKHFSDQDFCSKINACPSKQKLNRPLTVNKERCEFCTDLVDSFKSLLSESNNEMLKESLSNYCELTGDFKEVCLKNLDKNLDNFIDFVKTKMDSETFCHAIKSCHHQTLEEKKLPSVGDLVSLRDPVQMASHLDFVEQQQKSGLVDANPRTQGALSCMVCRQVIVIIYSQLHKNATRQNVEHLLAKACKTVHLRDKEKEKQCEEKVVKNAEIVLQSFINHIPPDLVCLLTGMCIPGEELNSQRLPSIPKTLEDLNVDQSLKRKGEHKEVELTQSYKCYFCEKIIDFMFKELDTNQTRNWIKHQLERSCGAIFKKEERQKAREKCEEYVDAYTDKLIDLIEKADNPGLICNALHMCPVQLEKVEFWDMKKLNHHVGNPIFNKGTIRDGPVFKIDWCKVCHVAYPILTDMMQIDEARDRINGIAKNLCEREILPINVTECKIKADEYLDIIAHVRDTEQGCKKVNLCPAKEQTVSVGVDLQVVDLGSLDEMILSDDSSNKVRQLNWWEDMVCSSCKLLIKGLYRSMNETINSPSTKDFINRACEHIHEDDLKEKCKADAQEALHTLLKDFENELLPEKACQLMKYCKKKDDVSATSLRPLVEKSACSTCKSLFPVLHRILQNEKVKNKVLNITDQLCEKCPKVDGCKKTMNELINDLADEETADAGCAIMCRDDKTSVSSIFQVSECTTCQATMLAVDKMFTNEEFQSKINQTLADFCESRKGVTRVKCTEFLSKNLPKLYELVSNLTDHDNGFCVTMGFCQKRKEVFEFFVTNENDADDLLSGADKLIPDQNELLDEDLLWSYTKGDICDGCKKVFIKINSEIKRRRNFKDDLLQLLLRTCPKNDDKCRKFYKKYINYFYELLIKETTPERACPAMRLCPEDFMTRDPNENDEWQPPVNLTESTVCKECESAVSYLTVTLNDKKVVDFIMKEIQQKICNPLSYIERKACNTLIKRFGPKLMKKFVDRINQRRICTEQLKLCKDENRFLEGWIGESEDDMVEFDLINFVEDPNCVVCQRSVEMLNAKRGDHDAAKYSVNEVCGDDSECTQFMIDFQDFFQRDDVNRDPIIACNELDICLIPGHKQLLGGNNKCVYGPAYWCLSAAHAEACKTTQFCKENHWQAVEN